MFRTIRYEQAVYGSFPFWSRGYAMLAASAGCLPEWRDAMRGACQRFGERPAGVDRFRSRFTLPQGRSSWMIVQVDSTGRDDHGRPGALVFHALFVSSWSHRRAGGAPWAFAPAFRTDWTAADQDATLPQGSLKLAPPPPEPEGPPDPRVEPIVEALSRRRRVIVQSPAPADELFQAVWRRLPGSTRRRTSIATWAFGNANPFDLLAAPRLAGLRLDGRELVLPTAAG